MPAVPVNVEVGLVVFAKLPPVPLTMLHTPVPIVGVLAAKVTCVKPQVAAPVWSGPALAAVGLRLNVILTSSVVLPQVFETVQRSTYVVPAVPEKVEVALPVLLKLPPVPLTIDQAPVPVPGVLAASVTCVRPQVDAPVWSGPALAVAAAAAALCSSCTPRSTAEPKGLVLPNKSVVGAPVFVPRFSTGEQLVI